MRGASIYIEEKRAQITWVRQKPWVLYNVQIQNHGLKPCAQLM